MEFARGQIEQDRLAAMPCQPREHVIHAQQPEHGQLAQTVKAPGDITRIDLALAHIDGIAAGIQQIDVNAFTHGAATWFWVH